ncbi:RRXRR domain-containing protein [Streptosporangium amethystogenes subsp. fukuiense]|uniref:RRXRR domain-containing protein n=1 Tax=Streptosporangium amethystogenes subsp. fukuiense TaxID=698418 RepID=A0ABW2SYZ9_9ACTN
MTTFHVGQQTDPVVLPQRRALESESADNPEGGDETGRGHCHLAVTGVEHGRGEIGSEGTRPIRRHAEGASVSEGENREVHPVVFVLDVRGHPLDPCHPARARRLLTAGRAVVHRHTAFVIRLCLLQRADGYGCTTHPEVRRRAAFPPPPEGRSIHAGGN